MSMRPDEFHDLLAAAVDDAPRAHALDPTAHGRARLRRRRAVAAAAVCVVSVGSAFTLVANGRSAPEVATDTPATTQASSTNDLVDACRVGSSSAESRETVFASGSPHVEVTRRAADQAVLVLRSADGRVWAGCTVDVSAPGAPAAVTQASAHTGHPLISSAGLPCGDDDAATCTRFVVAWVDRLPRAVRSVAFLTIDGVTTTVRAHDGYVALDHEGDLPASQTGNVLNALVRVRYLGSDGRPLAQADYPPVRMDADGTTVPDTDPSLPHPGTTHLPPLSAYPSRNDAAR